VFGLALGFAQEVHKTIRWDGNRTGPDGHRQEKPQRFTINHRDLLAQGNPVATASSSVTPPERLNALFVQSVGASLLGANLSAMRLPSLSKDLSLY
jgi:hypothetical protein